jgi:hypothetical protein
MMATIGGLLVVVFIDCDIRYLRLFEISPEQSPGVPNQIPPEIQAVDGVGLDIVILHAFFSEVNSLVLFFA